MTPLQVLEATALSLLGVVALVKLRLDATEPQPAPIPVDDDPPTK
jgi:hypothetical protein